jgi:uncharacterized protein DUF3551
MRRISAVFGILGLTLSIQGSTTKAEEFIHYPWCLYASGSDGGTEMCAFDSFEQCMLTRSGGGGVCFANPAYPAVTAPPAAVAEPPAAATEPPRQTPKRSPVNERRKT